ncbi:Ribonucleases P/MRP protein subunit POP1 [Pleurostoma richardsiae]|uniref:Ribonucleases P/MRP protein subunit POP1 n=1 Tax=Pleurostoma richardsiae TaxID=41990 RepID=A0AA38S2V3_9PEZI|nr:Ribonucleases P/MRP protein subunit POP1 [Pleurostoma richardsiae]
MGPKAANVPGNGPDARKRKDSPNTGGSNGSSWRSQTPTSGRGAKRVKVQDARSIKSQSATAALKDGELDLQAFLNAQEFQIRALEEGMRKSKAVNNRRAFQLVPRAMRRRTASHNVKRVPKRLRKRAMKEQMEDNTPTIEARRRRPRTTRARIRAETAKKLGILAEKKRKRKLKAAGGKDSALNEGEKSAMKQLIETRPAKPKIRRNELNEPPRPKAKFRKRQVEKTWLPTHLWHAKRSRMTEPKEPLWRFAIPLTPAEKVYRPTHRAAGERGAVMWDMSYMSTIGLYGHSPPGIERILKAIGLTHESLWDHRGQKWRDGCRKWSGMLSREIQGSRRDIGPATVLWNPTKIVEPAQCETEPSGIVQRQLYIRVHPACFLELFDLLTKLIKRETPRPYIEDLRFQIGSIEITGPASTEALIGVLHPYYAKEELKEAHASLFQSLNGVTNPSALPADVLLAFSAQDPRLRYPPRRLESLDGTETDSTNSSSISQIIAKWPADAGLKPFDIFDRNARFKASCLPSQKAIDRRKAANPPGEYLKPTAADPPIPVILFASRSPSGRQAQGTWTLLAPWRCILPIWHNLVHFPLLSGGNPRFGGLMELQQVAFEQGRPWFPGDFPWTNAGAEWELEQRERRRRLWERRPKSKRVAWESLDLGAGRKGEIGSGFACDYERLFGLAVSQDEQEDSQKTMGSEEMDVDKPEETAEGQKSADVAKKQKRIPPVYQLQHLSKAFFNTLLANTDSPPPNSLITVRITYLGRGVPSPCARIYRLPTPTITAVPSTQAEVPATEPPPDPNTLPPNLKDQWLAQIHRKPSSSSAPGQLRRFPPGADAAARKRLLAESLMAAQLPYPPPPPNQADVGGGHPLVPGEADLLGFVTTGTFSLAEGKGSAVGCVSAERALEALRRAGGAGPTAGVGGGSGREGRICVVRNAGENVGWVARWEVI